MAARDLPSAQSIYNASQASRPWSTLITAGAGQTIASNASTWIALLVSLAMMGFSSEN
jgi:hypothetical protein